MSPCASTPPAHDPDPTHEAEKRDLEAGSGSEGHHVSDPHAAGKGEETSRTASTGRTSESDEPGGTGDDEEEQEAAAEQDLIAEEQEENREQEEPKGVTGLLSGVLRWRQHHRHEPGQGAKPPEQQQSPLDPLATVDTRYLPIISGLACPFSVLLEIPGLTEPWYVKTYGYTVIDTRPNPVLLDIGLAFSLALGVAANICLVARFLEFRPKRFTLAAILALSLHDVINIAAVTWFGVSKRHADGYNYNDTFWMTVASTVASAVCNVTLILDLVRTHDFVRKGSGLTERQRALMVTVMFLFLYLGLGALCYFYLIPDLRFVDALFFVEVTVFTVGFGDPVPVTPGAKTFTVLYASVGIVAFALTVAVTRETIIETFEVTYRARRARLAQKARERKEHHLRRLRKEFELRQAHTNSQTDSGGPAGLAGEPDAGRLERHILSRYAATIEARPTGIRSRLNRYLGRFFGRVRGRRASATTLPSSSSASAPGGGGAALERRMSTMSLTSSNAVDVSFRTLKQQLAREEQQEFRTKLGISLFFFFIFWLGGAGVFVACEGWTYGNAVWFAFETFSTIGYGDFIPYTPAGRAFFVPWSIVGIGNMTLLYSVLSEAWSSRYKSNLQAGRVRRLIRGQKFVPKRQTRELGDTGTNGQKDALMRLLDTEAYKSVVEQPVAPEELPRKLVETVRAFHSHARYFMLGRTGDPPPELQVLLDAVDDMDTRLDAILAAKTSALAESAPGRDTKHYLFMISYEREFDRLVAAAGQLSTAIESAEKELVALQEENNRLEAELRQLRSSTANPDAEAAKDKYSTESPFPDPPSIPRTPTLSFTTPASANNAHRRTPIRRTQTLPRTDTAESTPASSLPAPSMGVRGGAATRFFS
ncbi:hypothetical protein JCM3774_005417 [Rhodotorula dairenensis]